MEQQHEQGHPRWDYRLTRRAVVRRTAEAWALVAGALATGGILGAPAARGAAAGTELRPVDAIQGILTAMKRFPLVAITERHMLQEWHDLITALLFHPAVPGTINDIVVEFGNAAYQDLADRFILGDQPVARADLEQIWRQIGDPAWNAPVYEQFFRTVRAVNWMQPPARRIRVLLGQAPITMDQVLAQPANNALVQAFVASTSLNAHIAGVVEREVLARGHRALLVAGGGHTLRGLRDDSDPHQLNAASRLAQSHPGALYVIDLLILPPSPPTDALTSRVLAETSRWPRPVIAPLAGTWLGATTASAPPWINEMADRTANRVAARYEAQADAVLYLGPGEALTASQPEPAIYHWGPYPSRLHQVSTLARAGDQVAFGLRWAEAGPSWFSLFE